MNLLKWLLTFNLLFILLISFQVVGAPYEEPPYIGPSFPSDERINELVMYQYKHCVDMIGDGPIIKNGRDYSCKNMLLTWTAENGAWGWWVVSPTNDWGICQLNYRRHKDFINDKKRFEDPINQIHYCTEVWMDAIKKGTMPWVAYSKKNGRKYLFSNM